MVVNRPRRAFQLPAQGFRSVFQNRCAERCVDQTRFFPRQSGGGRPDDFLKQLDGGVVNITRFSTRNNTSFRRHDFMQGAQLLLEQS
ncbi:hypothetical protein D3C75_996060 [compost metagenome]